MYVFLKELIMCFDKKVIGCILVFFTITSLAQTTPTEPPGSVGSALNAQNVLTVAPQMTVRLGPSFVLSAHKLANARELVATAKSVVINKEGVRTEVEHNAARVLISTEKRTSHEDALQRLADIAASRSDTAEFLEHEGWPAVQIKYTERLPRRGAKEEPLATLESARAAKAAFPEIVVQYIVTAIAAGDTILRFDATITPAAPPDFASRVQDLVRTTVVPKRGDIAEARSNVLKLQSVETNRQLKIRSGEKPANVEQLNRRPATAPDTLAPGTEAAAPGASVLGDSHVTQAASTGAVTVQAGVGELEIAASADARNVVLASNGGLSFSANRGASYAAGNTGVFGLNDPSLARAVSGNFYLGVIAFPNGSTAHLGVTGCTNAVSRSTNNGAAFTLRGYSAQCPNTGAVCFPDQEHIAADARNAAAGGDQLYAVWRNFTPATPVTNCGGIGGGFVTTTITCSQNSGTTWTAGAIVPGSGDLARVAVGRDGAVYVVSINGNSILLNRFTSCAAGLAADAGFPVTVATMSGAVTCPIAGLDRCNDGNTLSSPTVATDPDNANHISVSFAENNGGSSERIITLQSNNRGASFPTRQNVATSASTRRFMPWSCIARGRTWAGWYGRPPAVGGASNDRTDYFIGSSGLERNVSNNPDPQCASGWPCAPRSSNDSEACSVQPQLAGVCMNAAGGGSGARCDFSSPGCPGGESCNGGGGCPKYGDYNGIACAGNFLFAAWTSATSPAGTPAALGLRQFSQTLFVGQKGAPIWRHTGVACTGDSCPGWQMIDNNPKTYAIESSGNSVYQLHYDGRLWRHNGVACADDSCPGWQMLDNNPKTVAMVADGAAFFQLHNDGMIWRHTGTACTGESCPGWQRLDNNTKTVSIAASDGALFQLHNDGMIWRYTGIACSGESCPGWQRLDNNTKTVAITTGGGSLYQLHNDGMIWKHTGIACTGNSCPGWQRLDNNTKAVAIVAVGSALYQLHNDGMIWKHTGMPCTGNSCPGWQRLDNNPKTVAISAAGATLFQLHSDGMIWKHTGTPCTGESCPGWQRLDNNPRTGMLAAGDQLYQLHTSPVYQLHNSGWIWRYTGDECEGDTCPGWVRLDNNGRTKDIVAANRNVFQLHNDGKIWRSTGAACNGDACPGWQMMDNNPATQTIAAGGNELFQLHSNGKIWRSLGAPCNGTSCPGWQMLDNNPRTKAIAAAGKQLFQLHNDGKIWRYTGTPCNGNSCASWQMLDNNPRTIAIEAAGAQLFQLHNDGKIWRYTGTPCAGTSCPSWQMLDNNTRTKAISAAGQQLFQMHADGRIWRYMGKPCAGTSCPSWQMLDNNPATREIVANDARVYQRHVNGKIWRNQNPPCAGESCPGWNMLDNNSNTKKIVMGGQR